MSRRLAVIFGSSVVGLSLVACGPGRQAAWEKQSTASQDGKVAAPTTPEEVTNLAAQAEELWQKRDDRASLEKTIAIWEAMTAQDPNNSELWTKLSRGQYLLADTFMRLGNETETMLSTFEKGVMAGEKAMMAASPEFAAKVQAGSKVEEAVQLIPAAGQSAIYWYASNLGKFATAKGFTTRLFYKDRIFAVMQHVLQMDERFFHGAPHRYFGAFYAVAPSFAGGDLNKSKEHFDKALTIDSNYLGTKVLYAEFYATKVSDRELFTKLLNEVKAADPTSLAGLEPEQKFEQAKAARLLAQMNELFE